MGGYTGLLLVLITIIMIMMMMIMMIIQRGEVYLPDHMQLLGTGCPHGVGTQDFFAF